MYVRVHTQAMWDFRTTPHPLHAPASFWVRHMKSLFESGGFHSGVWANTFSSEDWNGPIRWRGQLVHYA